MNPNEKICGECGDTTLRAFSGETFTVGGETEVHGISGLRCATCGEVYLDHESQYRYVQASNALVLARREEEQQILTRTRKKLKLSQHQAAKLTGGGHNAFGRYERGEARPVAAVVNLFKLLDKHPELLKELA